MNLKQLIKLEDKSTEVWVVSPALHYDVDNKDFNELVSVNLGQKTKYRYIVPATKLVEKNMTAYKKLYNLSEAEMMANFLLLPESEFIPFITEIAIYNGNSAEPIACSAPPTEEPDEIIKFNLENSKQMAASFKALWKKYKRYQP